MEVNETRQAMRVNLGGNTRYIRRRKSDGRIYQNIPYSKHLDRIRVKERQRRRRVRNAKIDLLKKGASRIPPLDWVITLKETADDIRTILRDGR